MKGFLNDKGKLSNSKYGADMVPPKYYFYNMESSEILCVDYIYI